MGHKYVLDSIYNREEYKAHYNRWYNVYMNNGITWEQYKKIIEDIKNKEILTTIENDGRVKKIAERHKTS
jgi:hypothetical protein